MYKEMKETNIIGKRLIEILSKHNLSQRKFAKELGISGQYISKWLKNSKPMLSFSEMLYDYGFNINYLISGKGSPYNYTKRGRMLAQEYENKTIYKEGSKNNQLKIDTKIKLEAKYKSISKFIDLYNQIDYYDFVEFLGGSNKNQNEIISNLSELGITLGSGEMSSEEMLLKVRELLKPYLPDDKK